VRGADAKPSNLAAVLAAVLAADLAAERAAGLPVVRHLGITPANPRIRTARKMHDDETS
jgi:hypothetical protein